MDGMAPLLRWRRWGRGGQGWRTDDFTSWRHNLILLSSSKKAGSRVRISSCLRALAPLLTRPAPRRRRADTMCGVIAALLGDQSEHCNQILLDGLSVLQHSPGQLTNDSTLAPGTTLR